MSIGAYKHFKNQIIEQCETCFAWSDGNKIVVALCTINPTFPSA